MDIWIDILLAILTVYLAIRCMISPNISRSVFLFFTFGLILALAWIRLNAVDVAIAEAAIASGFMGALLLDSLNDFSPSFAKKSSAIIESSSTQQGVHHLVFMIVFGMGLLLFLIISGEAIRNIPAGGGLAQASEEKLSQSGVENPVTAVLLNYRAYDTWLEIGVILMSLLGILASGGIHHFRNASLKLSKDPILSQLIRVFTPLLFIFGAFLLYLGKKDPGGAFQAAVFWGAIGIMLHLGGWRLFSSIPRGLRPILITLGPLAFLLLGLGMMAKGGSLFEFPSEYAGFLILFIETLSAISIAATLTAIFAFLAK